MKTRSRKSNNKTRKLRKLPKNVIHGGLLGHEKKDFVKELEILNQQCKTTAGRQDLLEENLAFVATITGAIAIKNKLDFPPAGPFTDDKVKYQDARIRYILQGISEYNMNEIKHRKRYILGSWGAAHQTAMNANALASKSLRTGKALADWDIKKKNIRITLQHALSKPPSLPHPLSNTMYHPVSHPPAKPLYLPHPLSNPMYHPVSHPLSNPVSNPISISKKMDKKQINK